ncbi:hypothetical protein TELCIR_22718, partial [Teladorsagia circumcincta]
GCAKMGNADSSKINTIRGFPNCIIPLETRIVEEPLVAVRKREPVKNGAKKGAVKISLNDCLACSGCITSAETVLVEEQSITRLLEGMSSKQLSVITVCPQSVCSIAVKRNISVPQAAKLIASSPQAVTGALVKDYLSRRLEVPIDSIYHAAVMPCFDKKLEASRPDFYVPGTDSARETDCVISTECAMLSTFQHNGIVFEWTYGDFLEKQTFNDIQFNKSSGPNANVVGSPV